MAGFPVLVAYLSHGDDDQVRLFGAVFAYFSLGTIATPVLGGFLAAHLHSIRPVLGLSLLCLVGACLALWHVTPQPRVRRARGSGGVRALASNRRFLVIGGFHVLLMGTMTLTTNFLGPYLQDVDHASDAAIGLLGTCVSVGEVLSSLSLGRLSAWLGHLGTLLALQAVLSLSLLLLLRVPVVPLLVVPFLMRGVIITSSTLLFALAGGALPAAQRSAGFGLMETSYQVGAMAASYAGGLLYSATPRRPFDVSLVLLGLTMATSVAIRPLLAGRPSTVAAAEVEVSLNRPT
jgi:predicted MFS family arabinose efflux permease